jgi:hypothetical protein
MNSTIVIGHFLTHPSSFAVPVVGKNSSSTNNESQSYLTRQIIPWCSSTVSCSTLKNNKKTLGRQKMAPVSHHDQLDDASHSHGQTSDWTTKEKPNKNVNTYKKAPRNSRTKWEKMFPKGIFCDTMDGMKATANWVGANCTSVDESLIDALLEAIQKRWEEAKEKKKTMMIAFIDALEHCMDQLRPMDVTKQICQPHVVKSKQKEHDTNSNRYAALKMEDSDNDDEKENEVVFQPRSVVELQAADDQCIVVKFIEQGDLSKGRYKNLFYICSVMNAFMLPQCHSKKSCILRHQT